VSGADEAAGRDPGDGAVGQVPAVHTAHAKGAFHLPGLVAVGNSDGSVVADKCQLVTAGAEADAMDPAATAAASAKFGCDTTAMSDDGLPVKWEARCTGRVERESQW